MSSDDAPVLRAVDPPPTSYGAAGEPGLESLHAILEQVAADHGIQSMTVVVDDADVGRQAFRAGPGPHGALDLTPGVHQPEPLPDRVDSLALHALCAASLRAAVLDSVVSGHAPPELELRRLEGVCFVSITSGDDQVVEVVATPDAPGDVAHAVLETARRALGKPVTIVVERLQGDVPERVTEEQAAATAATPSVSGVELLLVQTTPETREIEVHVGYGDVRSIGRAAMAGGLAAAVEATLGALHELGLAADLRVGWARTVETTAEPSFVVTVALTEADSDEPSYGAASGSSPIQAAARASLLAAARA